MSWYVFFLFKKKRPIKRDQITVWSIKNSNLYNNFDLIWWFFIIMFSFYRNRNCVNVHWEMQSNTARLNFLLPHYSWPISDGLFSNIHRELFLSCVFLWIFSAVWNLKFPLDCEWLQTHTLQRPGFSYPAEIHRCTLTFEKWAKKIGLHLYCLTLLPCFLKKVNFIA